MPLLRVAHNSGYQAIVIGANCDGLAAAHTLARKGLRVLLLESGAHTGGVMHTDEIAQDYRISRTRPFVVNMPRQLEKKMKLAKRGLRYAVRNIETIVFDPDGKPLSLGARRDERADFISRFPADAKAYPGFMRLIRESAAVVNEFLQDNGNARDARKKGFGRLFLKSILLASPPPDQLARFLPASIGDILDETFETPFLKGALALDALLGASEGPYAPMTASLAVSNYMKRDATGGMSLPLGGTGAVTQSMLTAAEAAGVEVRVSVEVAHILSEQGTTAGVELQSGEIIPAPIVISAVGEQITLVEMLGAGLIDTGRAKRLSQVKRPLMTGKLNLALSGLPLAEGLSPEQLGARMLIAPSLEALDLAYIAAKRGQIPEEIPLEVSIPSIRDKTLAPEGGHVMSIVMQYAPADTSERDKLTARIIETLTRYFPTLKTCIVGGELLRPSDIDREYGLNGTDWYGSGRPPASLLNTTIAACMANPHTPARGLYVCDSASGSIGGEGHRVAKLALADRRPGWRK